MTGCSFCGNSLPVSLAMTSGDTWRTRVARLFDDPRVDADDHTWLRWVIAWRRIKPSDVARIAEIEAKAAGQTDAVTATDETSERTDG